MKYPLGYVESEHIELAEMVRSWVDRTCPKDRSRDLESQIHQYPHELWDDLRAIGLHGIAIPEEYGGQGGDISSQMVVARELARSLAGLTWVWGITSFSGAYSVLSHGTEEQKRDLLPKIASGDLKFSIAVTEPDGGTDVLGAMRTRAVPVDGGWRLQGRKMWSTAAQVADYLIVLARTSEAVDKKSAGLTLFLVPGDAEGLTTHAIPKLGLRSLSSCEVVLDDVVVSEQQVLGVVGEGWKHLLSALNNERIMVAAVALGILDGVIEEALKYAMERKAFSKPIGAFQAIQHYIADMKIAQMQGEQLVFYSAWLQGQGRPCGLEATAAKVALSDAAVLAADRGIQILGGMGYSMETHMQRYWRDVRLWQIGPITNEMARNTIAEMLGLPRSF